MNARLGFASTGQPLGWRAFAIAAVLAAAILFGGGGAEGSVNNGIILAASAALLFGLFAGHWSGARPLPATALAPLFLIAGFLLIGIFQLVPLPAEMWRGHPGSGVAASGFQLGLAGAASRPPSLAPEAARPGVD